MGQTADWHPIEERGVEWLEERWDSFHDSQVGPDYIYSWATRCGYDDARADAAAEKLEEMFGALPDDDGDADGGGPGAGATFGVGGSGAGSQGPTPAFDSHDVVSKALAAQLQPIWRFNLDSRSWMHFEGGKWVHSDGMEQLIQDH